MDKNLEQIQQLLTVFDKRQQLHNKCNREIAEILTPTLLTAVVELINVPNESIVWEDMSVVQSVLVLQVEVTYDPAKEVSRFLSLVTSSIKDNAPPIQVQRSIALGIPLTMVFQDSDIIKDWLMRVAENLGMENEAQPKPPANAEAPPPPAVESSRFDMTDLTTEQIQQVLFFQYQTEGTKQ